MKTKSILPCPCMALLAVAATAAGAMNCATPVWGTAFHTTAKSQNLGLAGKGWNVI
jgi:hypothetical protein